VNYITFVDLFASVCVAKKRILLAGKRVCGTGLPSYKGMRTHNVRGNARRASGEEHLEAKRRPAVPFLGEALFSDNIVMMSDYL